MKRMLLVIAVVLAAVSAQAQEMYLGGGISLWRNTDVDKTSFSITPDFGYNLSVGPSEEKSLWRSTGMMIRTR